jgi:hypothetical protein
MYAVRLKSMGCLFILCLLSLIFSIPFYNPAGQARFLYEMDTQQALILEEVQRPLVLGRRPIPEPNGNQVLLRIIAAGSMIR